MTAAAELHTAAVARLAARARAEADRCRAMCEGLIAPDPTDHDFERDQGYRRGRIDALEMLARWLDLELVEVGRAERALSAVPR